MAGRVAWSDDNTNYFLDICLEMKAGGLSKVNWDRIVSNLNVKSGKNFNIKQARNHWDDLRKKFKIWNEMELNWTGLTFDPITGCPVVEQDDRWNIFVKKHKGFPARFLRRPLPHLEKLRALFSGSFATSKWSFSPGLGGEQIGKENEERSGDNDENIGDMEISRGINNSDDEQSISPPKSTSLGKRKSDGCTSKLKKNKSSNIDSCIELLKMSIETNCKQGSGNKYKDVSDALYNIEAIVQQGEGFIYQCMNFLHHDDNADFFLGLRSDDQKIMYLKTTFQDPTLGGP
ncbi:uncharacterized protein LOC110698184 [Chenopodium quinoa]|uniref:uncharacterized protein LOC110698184 n=1 Tax=Chenopodium quinoa TaxID=63459 RepID=UPI000B76C33B|nr:uncharacterized protein LOC110698184 [Chenopodium quinoa]